MKQIYLFLLLSLFPFYIFAQALSEAATELPYTYIYRLDEQQRQRLYTQGWGALGDDFLAQAAIDSFRTSQEKINLERLPWGTLLLVQIKKEKQMLRLLEHSPLKAQIVANGSELQVLLYNTQSQSMESAAQVSVGQKKLVYDEKLGLYRLKAHKNLQGLLQVSFQGEKSYYRLAMKEFNLKKQNKRRFKKPSRLSKFFRKLFGKKSRYDDDDDDDEEEEYYDDADDYEDEEDDEYYDDENWRETVPKYYTLKPIKKPHTGYSAFSKPQYRPQDTLRAKLHLQDPKGKAFQKPLNVYLYGTFQQNNARKKIKSGLLPYRAGAYSLELPLLDSLKMNAGSSYRLVFEWEEGKEKKVVYESGRFKYADYSLKSINYQARLEKNTHEAVAPPNVLILSAKNENNQYQGDVQAEIWVLPQSITKLNAEERFVPDTLWHHRQQLDARQDTKITLPDSMFLEMALKYRVAIKMSNSQNEKKDFQYYAERLSNPEAIVLEAKGDTLHIRYYEVPSGNPQVHLLTYRLDNGFAEKSTISLPHRLLIEAGKSYEVQNAAEKSFFYHPLGKEEEVSVFAGRDKDSLRVNVRNPRGLPLWFQIFEKDRLVHSEFVQGHSQWIQAERHPERTYFIVVNYWWQNAMRQENYRLLPSSPNQLQVSISAPASASPGEEITLEVSVKNHLDAPVANADLTLYGITSKFGTKSHETTLPHPFVLRQAYRSYYHSFSLPSPSNEKGIALEEYQQRLPQEYWWPRLSAFPYYRFLYPQGGLFLQADSSRKGITQFAPYVVENGKLLPIAYILLDEVPIYASFALSQPYSFQVSPQVPHQISIRTDKSLITLKNVSFEEGKKTILSVENNLGLQTSQNPNIEVEARPDTLSKAELDFIKSYTLALKANLHHDGFYWVQQENKLAVLSPRYRSKQRNNMRYNLWGRDPLFLTGFSPAKNLTFHTYQGEQWTFKFQKDALHSFDSLLVKAEPMPKKVFLPKAEAPPLDLDEEVASPEEIAAEVKHVLNTQRFHPYFTQKGYGTLRMTMAAGLADSLQYVVLLYRQKDLIKDIRIYYKNTLFLHQLLPEQAYEVYFLYPHSFARYDFQVKANGTLHKHFTSLQVRPNDDFVRQILKELQKDPQVNEREVQFALNKELARKQISVIPRGANTIIGRVLDESGLPALLVRIFVESLDFEMTTDEDGYFSFQANLPLSFLVSSFGEEKYIKLDKQNAKELIVVFREPQLKEVIITGYTIQEKRELTGGIRVRGTGSIYQTGDGPIYIIDGKVVSADVFKALPPEAIASVESLQGDAASAIYGSMAATGVVIVLTKSSKKVPEAPLGDTEANPFRSNFRDDAFWQPLLTTDALGLAKVKVKLPEDLTRWNIYALAAAEGGRFGESTAATEVSLQLSASLALPRFAIEGDSLQLLGKVENYTGTEKNIRTRFEWAGQNLAVKEHRLSESLLEKQWLQVGKDTLRLRYLLEEEGQKDGEERLLPVLPKGTLEAAGQFARLGSDTTLHWNFDSQKGMVKLYVSADLHPLMDMELKRLQNYEYLCNEQMASKLMAYLLQKRIREANGQPFKYKKDVQILIKKLKDNRNEEGLWGWWGKSEYQDWVSLHIIRVLLVAEQEGFANVLAREQLRRDLMQIMDKTAHLNAKVAYIEVLEQLDAALNYQAIAKEIWTEHRKKDVKSRERLDLQAYLSLQRVLQKRKLPYHIDTLYQTAQPTLLGNRYWSNKGTAEGIWYNKRLTTLKALQLLQNDSTQRAQALQHLALGYLLEEKNYGGHWVNTYETALILEALLPYLDTKKNPAQKPVLQLSGALSKQVDSYPMELTFAPGQALQVERQGSSPHLVYISAHQQYFEPAPKAVSAAFEVNSYFSIDNRPVTYLEAGQEVELVVEINAKESNEYVLVEIPLPAGCSYEASYTPANWDVQRHRICIFLKQLSGGKHRYRLRLLPQYSGLYTLNPAKVEMMYRPHLYGRTALKNVEIRSRKEEKNTVKAEK